MEPEVLSRDARAVSVYFVVCSSAARVAVRLFALGLYLQIQPLRSKSPASTLGALRSLRQNNPKTLYF
ncbi:MAG: hypothetical protein WCH57_01855, partial [Verrucomicrobiota bacterium]